MDDLHDFDNGKEDRAKTAAELGTEFRPEYAARTR